MPGRPDLEQALESRDLDRAAAAVREVVVLPGAARQALADALAVATERVGADPACGAALVRIWHEMGADRGVQRALTLLVARDPAAAERAAAEAGLAGDTLVARLREASAGAAKDALERRLNEGGPDWFELGEAPTAVEIVPEARPTPEVDALRAWADRVEGRDAESGRVAELHAALAQLGRFERGWMCCTIDRLAACAAPSLPSGAVDALAHDLSGLADDEAVWPWLRLLSRHLPKLGPLGSGPHSLAARLVPALVRAAAAVDDREALGALASAGDLDPADLDPALR